MQNTLSWKKGLFKCTFQLFAGGYPVGQLKDSEFSRTAHGRLNNKEVAFRRCEGWRTKVEILDKKDTSRIGQISFNPWYPKATIHLGNQEVYWSFSNLWETRWKITDSEGLIVTYKGWSGKGEMTIMEQDDLLVLAGLYISNYYWRLAAILFAIILPTTIFPLLF